MVFFYKHNLEYEYIYCRGLVESLYVVHVMLPASPQLLNHCQQRSILKLTSRFLY